MNVCIWHNGENKCASYGVCVSVCLCVRGNVKRLVWVCVLVNSRSGRSVNHLGCGRWQVWRYSGHCSSYTNTHTQSSTHTASHSKKTNSSLLPPTAHPFIPSFFPCGWTDPCHVAWLTAPSVRAVEEVKRRDGGVETQADRIRRSVEVI